MFTFVWDVSYVTTAALQCGCTLGSWPTIDYWLTHCTQACIVQHAAHAMQVRQSAVSMGGAQSMGGADNEITWFLSPCLWCRANVGKFRVGAVACLHAILQFFITSWPLSFWLHILIYTFRLMSVNFKGWEEVWGVLVTVHRCWEWYVHETVIFRSTTTSMAVCRL